MSDEGVAGLEEARQRVVVVVVPVARHVVRASAARVGRLLEATLALGDPSAAQHPVGQALRVVAGVDVEAVAPVGRRRVVDEGADRVAVARALVAGRLGGERRELVVEPEGHVAGVHGLLLRGVPARAVELAEVAALVLVAGHGAAAGDLEEALAVARPGPFGNLPFVIGTGSGSVGGAAASGMIGQTSHRPAVLVTVQLSLGLVTVAPSGTRSAAGSSTSMVTVRVVVRVRGRGRPGHPVVDVLRVPEGQADDHAGLPRLDVARS